MGTWGTGLYSNDVTSDIRSDYKDALCFGKTNEAATTEVINKYKEVIGTEDETLFWSALADTQWDFGRLTPDGKQKALYCIENNAEHRWDSAKDQAAWEKTLEKLKEKLQTEQPPEKSIKLYQSFRCEWLLGDVFAYRFESEYSKESGFYKKYIVFRKVSECHSWPDQIVPIVHIYKWLGDHLPTLDEISDYALLEVVDPPIGKHDIMLNRLYNLKIEIPSKKSIPHKRLTYLGNIPGDDLIPYQGPNYYYSYYSASWTARNPKLNFERFIIRHYQEWMNQA